MIMKEAPGWPELLPFMSQAVQSGQQRLMEAALLVFAQLAGHMMPTLLQYMGTLHQVLHSTPVVLLRCSRQTLGRSVTYIESPGT